MKMDPKLLDNVRRRVLSYRARYDTELMNFGLSQIEDLGRRGHIQRCLSLLAKEGIMYERTRPEGYVAPYAHCETDKHFRIRISQVDAIAKLQELGIKF